MSADFPLLEHAPRSLEYVPDPIELKDHVPVYIPKHPENLLPAEDEVPIEAYIPEVAFAPTPPLPPSFLSPHIQPPHTRAAMAHMRATVPSTYHSLLPLGTPPLLPIPLPIPSASRRAEILEADTPPQKRPMLTAPRSGREVAESSAARQPGPTMARSVDCSFVDTMETRKWPKRTTRSTQVSPVTPAPTATTTTITKAQLQALIDRGVAAAMAEAKASRDRYGYDSNGSRPRLAQAIRECTYLDFLKCQPLNFKGTEGVVGLAQWFKKYIGGLPDTIHDSVKATRPKTMHEAIEFATELMDKRIRDVFETNRSLRVPLETIKTSHIRIRGRTLAGPMPQAIVTGIYTQGLNL
nr:hypothetical protein [Tanacetum cinerariifolium]